MSADRWGLVGLGLYVVAVVTALGVRTWAHRRSTGSTGFRGVSGPMGSSSWWAGVLFPGALVLGLVGLSTAAVGRGPTVLWTAEPVAVVGLALGIVGLAVTLAAQSAMGASWRIGVDESERTPLVTTGLFRVVRNPIFSGMAAVSLGAALMVPTVVTVAAFVCLVVAVQIQVRVVEEPYLTSVHGSRYAQYGARRGRFVPGVGRLRPSRSVVGPRAMTRRTPHQPRT